MADTGTCTEAHTRAGEFQIITFTWTSTAGGAVSHEVLADNPHGFYCQCDTNPGAAAPTADYDIEFLNEDGADMFTETLHDRHTTASEVVTLSAPVACNGTPTFTVANAGNAKSGVAKFYFTKRRR